MKSSSTEVNLWRVPAQPEHRRQDGWTSTLCVSVGVKQDSDPDTNAGERLQKQRPHPNRRGCCDGCVVLAGERLQNQRPLGEEHLEHKTEEHFGAQFPHQDEEAGSVMFHSSSKTSEIKNDNNEARVMASAAAKVSEDLSIKDAEILRLIRASKNVSEKKE